MPIFVLVSTLAVCLSTWLAFARGGDAAPVTDALFVSGPCLVLGIYLFVVSRKEGLRDTTGLLVPRRVGLLCAWLPNFLILALLGLYFFLKIVNSGTYALDELTNYFMIFPVWVLSILTGLVGAADTRTARDKQEAKRKESTPAPANPPV
jgi:hypothetical protein